jgi:hypothetical protein
MARILDDSVDYLSKHRNNIPPVIAVLALVGLGRLARLATLGMGVAWLARELREIDRSRTTGANRAIDTAMEDTFPASDAPSYSPTTAGSPDQQVEAVKRRSRISAVH